MVTFSLSAQSDTPLKQTMVTSLTMQNGLPNDNVRDILFDRDGTVWFATMNGLAHFDGARVDIYQHQSTQAGSMPSSNIHSLKQDNQGRIWLAGNGKLSFLNASTDDFIAITTNTPACDNGTRDIISDRDGHIWSTNNVGAILKYDIKLGKAQCFTAVQHLVQSQGKLIIYEPLYDSKRHGLWLATDAGLVFFDMATLTSHYVGSHFVAGHSAGADGQSSLSSVFMDAQGHIWGALIGNGMIQYDPVADRYHHFTPADHPLLQGVVISHMSQRSADDTVDGKSQSQSQIQRKGKGKIWLSTTTKGIITFSDGQFHRFNGIDTIRHQPISSSTFKVKQDWHNNVWIATMRGVYMVNTNVDGISSIGLGTIIADDKQPSITSLLTTPQNDLIVSTKAGLFQLDLNRPAVAYSRRIDHQGLDANGFGAIYFDNLGDRYFCNAAGIFRENRSSQTLIALSEGLGIHWCSAFYGDDSGHLWISTQSVGLVRFDKNTEQFDLLSRQTDHALSTFSHMLLGLHQGQQGGLWLASADNGFGLFSPQTQQFTSWQHQPANSNSLPGNMVTDIFQDNQGYLWLATFNGLSRFDPKTQAFTNFHVKDGLTSEQLNAIRQDQQGNLWISAQYGINKINPITFEISRYYQSDGLLDNEFNLGPAVKANDGLLYFGGVNGVTVINPTLFRPRPQYRNFISRVMVKGVKQAVLGDRPLMLNDNTSRLTINFGITAYAGLANHQFRYRLKGFESQWQTSAKTADVDYANLPYGDYTFEVQGKTQSGQWITPSASITLNVPAPFYLTPFAYILYLLLLMGFMAIVVHIFTLAEKRKALELRQKIDLQTDKLSRKNHQISELLAQQKHLFVQLSHEIRTPLTLVFAPWQQLSKAHQVQYKSLFDVANYNQQRLVSLLDQLLDIAQSPALTPTLSDAKKQATCVADAVNWVCTAIQPLMAQKQQQFILTLHNPGYLLIGVDALEKILLNLLVNAHKYTPAGGHIELTAECCAQGKTLTITVNDDGIGIAEDQQQRIFNCFTRIDTAEYHAGSGVGLALVKQLIEVNEGSISLVSQPDKGSCFSLQFASYHGDEKPNYQNPEDSSLQQQYLVEQAPTVDVEVATIDENSQQPLILVVEDNPQMRQYLGKILKADYQLLFADNGQMGLDCAIERVPDIVISDIMMPIMDGYALLDALKSHPATNHVPVILLTARTDQHSQITGLQHMADDYISKPFNEQVLLLKLQNLLHMRTMWYQSYQLQQGALVDNGQPANSETIHTASQAIILQLNPVQQKVMDQLQQLLEQNYHKSDFGIDQMAEQMLMNKRQLQRKIKALCGENPLTMLKDLRLEKARLAIETGQQITAVGFECGFNNYDYFSRSFKEKYQLSPKHYLEKVLGEKPR